MIDFNLPDTIAEDMACTFCHPQKQIKWKV